jgi:Uma2 family endonuclease
MMAMPLVQQMTAEEYLALPITDESRWLQLVDGELVVTEATMLHNVVQVELLFALRTWVTAGEDRGRVCVPLDVGLDEHNVFAPDVSWYSSARMPDVDARRPYPPPDLAIEVRSPSTWVYDIGAKRLAYERHGLPELWLVDTAAEAVLAFRRSQPGAPVFDEAVELERGETLTSPLLPEFALRLEEVFGAGD